jgi:hypothetical protein
MVAFSSNIVVSISNTGGMMSRPKASEKPADQLENVESVEPKIKIRSQQAVHHHLFKAQIAKMKKNISFTPGQPDIRDVEHVHFFHSVNSLAMPQTHTSEVGGHFHEVTWETNANGDLVAKCGPPLKRISKKGRNGQSQTKIVPVKWQNLIKENDQDPDWVEDNHLHQMTYEGSDLISSAKIQEVQKQQAKLFQQKQTLPKPDTADIVDNDR